MAAKPSRDYGMQVGEAGRTRLEILNRVLNPHSLRLLEENGLQDGVDVLELGCGIGIMSSEIAQRIGSSGRVTAVDSSPEQLALAQTKADSRGLSNIDFVCETVGNLDMPPGGFDVIYCRFILVHVANPDRLLERAATWLKPGGILICEEGGKGNFFSCPTAPAYDEWVSLLEEWALHHGINIDIGYKLPSILGSLGLEVVNVHIYQPVLRTAEEKSMFRLGVVEAAPALLSSGIITHSKVTALADALRHFEQEVGAYASFVPIAQVVARRPALSF